MTQKPCSSLEAVSKLENKAKGLARRVSELAGKNIGELAAGARE